MLKQPRVLAIDDDINWLSQIPLILEDQCEVTTVSSIDQGISVIQIEKFDAIILDMNFDNDPRSGLDIFRLLRAKDINTAVIVISGETRPDRLVHIMNAGVTKFLPKPCSPDDIRESVKFVIRANDIKMRTFENSLDGDGGQMLIGRSDAMIRLRQEIEFAVKGQFRDILLKGDTGTGKEVVAKFIAKSTNPKLKLLPIHCGAISDGIAESELFGHVKGAYTGADKDRESIFELVNGGFVFLDEIGDMSPSHQAKLLRVLQERQIQRVGSSVVYNVDFRTIAATHVDLNRAIEKKEFRSDLYYRLAKAVIYVPTLKDRKEDIPDLVHHFIYSSFPNRSLTFTEESIELLKSYHWPGNVRELKFRVEQIVSRSEDGIIREQDICFAIPEVAGLYLGKKSRNLIGRYGASIISEERSRYEKALKDSLGVRGQAAKLLGVSRATFYRKALELGILQQNESSRLALN